MKFVLAVSLVVVLLSMSEGAIAEEWSTPEALRAFGKPGDTVKSPSAAAVKRPSPPENKTDEPASKAIENSELLEESIPDAVSKKNLEVQHKENKAIKERTQTKEKKLVKKRAAAEPKPQLQRKRDQDRKPQETKEEQEEFERTLRGIASKKQQTQQ